MATAAPPVLPNPEQRAREVAQQLTRGLGQSQIFEYTRSAEVQLLADVEAAMEELNFALNWWGYSPNSAFPCIRDGEDIVPIVTIPFRTPFPFPEPFFPPFHSGELQDYAKYFNAGLRASLESYGVKIEWSEVTHVPEMVFGPLAKFLTVRFQWIADNPEFRSLGAAAAPSPTSNPYLRFTVHTRTSGLRIHYSKAFAISFTDVFGAPTTPVKGWILPGIHKFAGVDSHGRFHYDNASFKTPPDFSANLVI